MLIGITGLIGSGKDTIAGHLVENYNYERYSWATPLKDITAMLFGWDRDVLEGTTPEQRLMREQVDTYWSDKLDSRNKFGAYWTPRFALQYMGTEVMRNALHPDIWVLAGMHRIAGKENVVISDTRFPNEIRELRKIGGMIWNVKRGSNPVWFDDLTNWKQMHGQYTVAQLTEYMNEVWPGVHASEYSWHGTEFDVVIENNGSIEDLKRKVDLIIGN